MAYGPYKDLIIAAAQRKGINPVILAGLINQESNFDPTAVGDKGRSFGLGQFNVNGALKTYKLTGEQVLSMDPAQQIDLVADFYKKNLIVAKGDDDKALRLYNGGGDPNYVNRVHRRINKAGIGSPITELPPVTPRKNITGINPEFQESFNQFQQAAKAQGFDITPSSGFRDKARQAQLWAQAVAKYGTPAKARKWVAPPGSSSHEYGLAMDLKYGSPEARKWAHANAAKFGLNFRMANEPWHIEPIGARQQISPKQSFGNHTIDITKPAGFEQSVSNFVPTRAGLGFSNEMIRLLSGNVIMDDEDQVVDPNTANLQQLLGAQQAAGQQPNNIMSSIMSNPLIHMGLGIMAGEGNFAQQLSGGLLMGMKNYQAYQQAEQEAQLSQARLRIQAMNAETQAKAASERILSNSLKRSAIANLPEPLKDYAAMELAGLDPDIIKQQYLQHAAGLDPQTAAVMSITGRTPQTGQTYKEVAGAPVLEERKLSGEIASQVAEKGELSKFAQAGGQIAGVKAAQTEFGKDEASTYQSLGNLPKYDYMIQRIDDLAAKVQASDAPMTGPIIGALQGYIDPFLAELDRFNTDEALDKVTESKLAPVSNVDLAEVKSIIASPKKTKAQVLTLLKLSKQMYEQRRKGLRDVGEMLGKGKRMEDIYLERVKPRERLPETILPGPARSAYGPEGSVGYTAPTASGTAGAGPLTVGTTAPVAPTGGKRTITVRGRTVEVED